VRAKKTIKTGSDTGSVTLTRDPTRPGQNRWPGDPWPDDQLPTLMCALSTPLQIATLLRYQLTHILTRSTRISQSSTKAAHKPPKHCIVINYRVGRKIFTVVPFVQW